MTINVNTNSNMVNMVLKLVAIFYFVNFYSGPLSRKKGSIITKHKVDRKRNIKVSSAASIIKNKLNNRNNSKVDVKWYQIKVFGGADEIENNLIERMSSIIDDPIEYRQYHVFNGAASFYVFGKSKADALLLCNGQLTSSFGDETLKVVRYTAKSDVYSDEQLESIKECIKNRINVDQGILDLSGLSFDETLNTQNIKLSLHRSDIFTIVVNILNSLFRESDQNKRITILNLENNKIKYISIPFIKNSLVVMFPNINRLSIAENHIKTVEDLKALRDWNLVELKIYDSSQDDSVEDCESISNSRKIFPDLIKLNCREYEPPVKIDVAEYELPNTMGSNFALIPDIGKEVFINHVKSFFSCLDQVKASDDVNNFYCEDSQFSLTISSNNRDHTMDKYLKVCNKRKSTPDNRHESRVGYNNKQHSNKPDPEKYYFGREKIVKTLRKLPHLKHVNDSFVCDVALCTNELISYVISGTFEEVATNGKVRAFTRNILCTVSYDLKFTILSDMLHIRNQSFAEKKESAVRVAATRQLPQQPTSAPGDVQNEMVRKFMKDSGMNFKYSHECLHNNGWDYDNAGRDFMQLQKNNKIPLEAFQF